MLNVNIHEEDGIVVLEPHGALTQNDFVAAAAIIDPFIERYGKLNGVMIHSKVFPGWDSFSSMLTHLEFVRDHHTKIARVAMVTDSIIGDLAEVLTGHFVQAEVKHFGFNAFKEARLWVLGLL